jgi:hypothetical protein
MESHGGDPEGQAKACAGSRADCAVSDAKRTGSDVEHDRDEQHDPDAERNSAAGRRSAQRPRPRQSHPDKRHLHEARQYNNFLAGDKDFDNVSRRHDNEGITNRKEIA